MRTPLPMVLLPPPSCAGGSPAQEQEARMTVAGAFGAWHIAP